MESINIGNRSSHQWKYQIKQGSHMSLNSIGSGCWKELFYFQANGQLQASSFATVIPKEIENMKPLDTIVDKLKPISYVNTFTKQKEYGFLSDELQKIFPEIVSGESINYIGLIPILVKEIQDLKKQIYLLTDSQLCNSPCSSVKSAELSYDKVYNSNDIQLNGLTGTKMLNRPETFFIKPASFRGITGPSGTI